MANIYVRSGATGTGTGADWANAYTTLGAAATAAAGGDTYFVAADHAESTAGVVALVFKGSATAPDRVLCVDHTALVPPVNSALRTTASVTATGGNNVTIEGHVYIYGMKFYGGDTGSSFVVLGNASISTQTYENCLFGVVSVSSNAGIWIGAGTSNGGGVFDLINCKFNFNHASHGISPRGGKITIRNNETSPFSNIVPVLAFIRVSTQPSFVTIDSVDLSAIASASNIVSASTPIWTTVRIVNCKLASGVVTTTTVSSPTSVQTDVQNSGTTIPTVEAYRFQGTMTTERAIYRAAGAYDAIGNISHKVVTISTTRTAAPFECIPMVIYNADTHVAKTLFIDVLTDNVSLTNNDAWIEVEYLGNSEYPLATTVSSGTANPLITATTCPLSPVTWTSTGLTTPLTQRLQVTFTPKMAGNVRVVLKIGKASTTVYYDPRINISGGIAPKRYEGLVSNRATIPNITNGTHRQTMARKAHVATTDINSFKALFPNFRLSSGVELGLDNATTVEASVEYPAGTYTRLTFPAESQSGGDPNVGLIPALASTGNPTDVAAIWTNYVNINIPRGATFWIRTWTSTTSGGIFYSTLCTRWTAGGDFLNVGTTSANVVMGGAITHNAAAGTHGPMALVGPTDSASVVLIGDSIMWGQNASPNQDGRVGIIGASIPEYTAMFNSGAPGAKTDTFMPGSIARALVYPYASHVVNNLGINDTGTAADRITRNTAVAALFPATAKKYLVTLTPRTSSSDSWATTANQTLHGGTTTYQEYNSLIRATTPAGYDGYIEVTRGILEAAPADSGKWIVDGTAAKYTADGLHLTTYADTYLPTLNVIPTRLFKYPFIVGKATPNPIGVPSTIAGQNSGIAITGDFDIRFTGDAQVGSLAVLVVVSSGVSGTLSVASTDSAGNTWTLVGATSIGGNRQAVFKSTVTSPIVAGTTTLVANTSAAGRMSVVGARLLGVSTQDHVGAGWTGSSTSSTATIANAVRTTNNQLVLAYLRRAGNTVLSEDVANGWATVYEDINVSNNMLSLSWKIVTDTTAVNHQPVWAGSSAAFTHNIMSFKI